LCVMTGSDVVPPENWDEITAGSTGEQVTAPAGVVQSLGAPMIWVTCTTLLRFVLAPIAVEGQQAGLLRLDHFLTERLDRSGRPATDRRRSVATACYAARSHPQ
jgi:hypothetical protein